MAESISILIHHAHQGSSIVSHLLQTQSVTIDDARRYSHMHRHVRVDGPVSMTRFTVLSLRAASALRASANKNHPSLLDGCLSSTTTFSTAIIQADFSCSITGLAFGLTRVLDFFLTTQNRFFEVNV